MLNLTYFKMQPLFLRIILISVFISVFRLTAQETVTYTKKDGILSFPVTTTFVDSKGVVWIGTGDGLNAFTGSKWYSLKQIENKVTNVKQPLKDIVRIYEDRKRNLWFVTGYGVFLYDGTYWVNYISNEEENDYKADVIFEDRRGWIWITQEYRKEFNEISALGYTLLSGSVKMFDGYEWYRFDDEVAESVASKFNVSPTYVTKIIQDRMGNMWFATLEGLYMFDGGQWFPFKDETFEVNKVFDVLEDRSGNIWAATEAGVSKYYDGQWINFDKKDGLSGNSVYQLLQDKSGRIWAFSRNDIKFTGLSMHDEMGWKYFDPRSVKIKGKIEKLFSDNDDVIVFSDDGISRYDEQGWHRFDKKDGLDGNDFSLIYRDDNKELWTASETSLMRYDEGNWKTEYSSDSKWKVTGILVDDSGAVWVGTNKSGLFYRDGNEWKHFTSEQTLTDNHVERIFEDKRMNIWVVTKKGITKFSNLSPQ